MVRRSNDPSDFNVGYGLASAVISVTSIAIATTEAAYHGISVIAGATSTAKVTIYDSAGGASGNIVDIVQVDSAKSAWIDRFIPVQARRGLYMVATGTGIQGAVFYGPKG